MVGFIFMSLPSTTVPSHGAAMDRMYRLQRHFYDFTRRYYLLGRDRMLDGLKASNGQSILEIGCGTGRNLIGTAKRYPACTLYGIDISNEMLKSAAQALHRASIKTSVTIAQADATNFDSEKTLHKSSFDRIYFSYTLSMVPQWQRAIHHATTLLAEAGELHIVDFGQCENWPRGLKSLLFRWLALFHVSPRPDMPEMLNQLASELGCTLVTQKDFGGYAWRFRLARS